MALKGKWGGKRRQLTAEISPCDHCPSSAALAGMEPTWGWGLEVGGESWEAQGDPQPPRPCAAPQQREEGLRPEAPAGTPAVGTSRRMRCPCPRGRALAPRTSTLAGFRRGHKESLCKAPSGLFSCQVLFLGNGSGMIDRGCLYRLISFADLSPLQTWEPLRPLFFKGQGKLKSPLITGPEATL